MAHVETSQRHPGGGLASGAFGGFLITQFLGAMNDNMFRWLVVPLAKLKVEPGAEAWILAAGSACFVLPYLLVAPHAGYLADRFSKRKVIVGCKVAEIVIMLLGAAAFWIGNATVLFVAVALIGTQSALFSPSKLGIIPELVRPEKISSANGVVGLTTVIAVVIGSICGNLLFARFLDSRPTANLAFGYVSLWPPALAVVVVAVIGWAASLLITRVPAGNPQRRFPRNPVTETIDDLRSLGRNRTILRVALGIAFFWSLAAMAQLNVDTFAIKNLLLTQDQVGPLLAILSFGVGVGSVLAGWWSGGKVELGIVPLGAAVIAVSSTLLAFTGDAEKAYFWTASMLLLLGAGGGLFNVPLVAFLQHRSPKESRGAVLAASNFVTFAGILIVSVLFGLAQGSLKLEAPTVWLIAGIGTIPVMIYAYCLLPQATIRFLVWLASHSAYRVRVFGRENLPETGGALIVANHVTWLDGALLLMVSSRPIRMLAYGPYIKGFGIGWLARTFNVIPILPEAGPKGILRSLQTARDAVANGELVCIFPEGGLTRTGQLQPFQRGMLRAVQGTGAPVIPTFLDELWGSIFSFRGGRFFWKWPRRWPYPVGIHFGKPLTEPDDVYRIRRAVEQLGVEAVEQRKDRQMTPPRSFIRCCRSALWRSKVADSTGAELTGGKLLAGTLVMKGLLDKHVLSPDEKFVGVLLPPSVGATVVNAALTVSRRVAVNLNYTLSNDDVNYCIREAGIKHVITSGKFLEKRPFDMNAEVVLAEDLRGKVTGLQKLTAALQAFLLPACCLDAMLGLKQIQPDDLMTVVFTSGSTGEPKGVMLSHHNVGSNVDAVDQLFRISREDVLLGVLPFFHSFGYTATLWLVLILEPKAVYHFNPLDGRQIGKLCGKHGVSIILATPTFLRTYLKRCEKEEMRRMDLAIVGAEKMPLELAQAFQEKFGVTPTEGYGATELSPIAAFNVPDHRAHSNSHDGTKLGSVGRAMPGTAAKVVDPDTRRDLGTNQDGLLLIKGPNVMLGYLHRPEKTAELIQDGWYNTGDIARIDDDGFIFITGRQSRFSKIGGEMVPHLKIEELLAAIVEDHTSDEPEIMIGVTAVPDEKKGERLVVVHKRLSKPVDEILQELSRAGLPNLWLPSADSFVEVEEIPLLGSGKLDLKRLKERALAAFPA